MQTKGRSIEKLVDEQVRRWELRQREKTVRRPPVIAISRLFGTWAEEAARELSKQLSLDLFDKQILNQISEKTGLSEKLIAALDEKGRTLIDDWLSSLYMTRPLSSKDYGYHLPRIIGAISEQGGAVLLGRGASMLLTGGDALRVLVIAPLRTRIKRIASAQKIPEQEARRLVMENDADRKSFVMKYYHAEFLDPVHYDLVVNDEILEVQGVVAAIRGAVEKFPSRARKR